MAEHLYSDFCHQEAVWNSFEREKWKNMGKKMEKLSSKNRSL